MAHGNRIEGDATNVVQARDVHELHVHLAGKPATGQIVVGPVPREPLHFQHREQVARLAELAGSVAVLCAVTGQRGVGKTQVAGAYARQCIAEGRLVAWIPAETADQLVAGLVELADALGLRRADEDATTAVTRLRQHLQTLSAPALLVFDNVVDPSLVAPHLPAAGSAQIVLTSAAQAVSRMGVAVPVDLFTPEAAVRFLSATTGLRDDEGAAALATELGHLPLALAQAAARIATIERDYDAYLRRLADVSVDRYLTARPGDPYPRGTAAAILLAIEPFDGPERELLDLLSVLSPDGVSRELLSADDELEKLFEASLVEFAGNGHVVMHRVTQRVLRDHATHEGRLLDVLDDAVHLVRARTFPEQGAWERRDFGADIVRQAEALWDHTLAATPSAHLVCMLLELRNWGVGQLVGSASPVRAVLLATTLHDDCRRTVSEHHPVTLGCAINRAHAYRVTGRVNEAVELLEWTLSECRRVLGGDHQYTLAAANHLATAYRVAGRPANAVLLNEESLAAARRLLGTEHAHTFIAANNLAGAYRSAGRLDEAVALQEQSFADIRKAFGDGHPPTLSMARNLAAGYASVERLDDAVDVLEQALGRGRETLPTEHPVVLRAMDALACLYYETARPDEAVDLWEQCHRGQLEALGGDHPDTLTTTGNLAMAYSEIGRPEDAVELLERKAAGQGRLLGDHHPDTLATTDTLADLYVTLGRLDKSVLLYEKNLDSTRAVLGEDHEDTLWSASLLAAAYLAVGRSDDAESLWQRTIATAQRVHGPEHSVTRLITYTHRTMRKS